MSRDRRYLSPELGGAGLINIRDFLIAQKCSWIKRAAANVIDNWRLSLAIAAPEGDILNIRACDIDPAQHMILHELAWAYEFFIGCFSLIDNNHLKNTVFQNAAFVRSGRDSLLLDINFFGKKYYNENKTRIRKLTFDDCFTDGKFKSINDFTRDVGLVFPPTTWMNLQTAITYAKKILAKTSLADKKGQSVNKFVSKSKKGSKPFRQTIDNATYLGESCVDLTIVRTYARITHNAVQPVDVTKKFLSSWNKVYLDNKLREFIYKCRHNILKTGDRLAHILNTDSYCFFCKNLPQQLLATESFFHLFFECPVTNSVLNMILIKNNIVFDLADTKFTEAYWYGTVNKSLNIPTLTFFDIFRYCIWNLRLRKKIPRLDTVTESMVSIINTIFHLRPNLRRSFEDTPHLTNFFQAIG
jgi:hypothetical protein